MKCPKCNGSGDIPRPNGTKLFGLTEVMTCDLCNGSGEVEMTNEEWFCSLSTEEKAEFLKKIIQSCGWCLDGGNPPYCLLSGNKCFFHDGDFVDWLKEIHDEMS